jgi:hypothetical protein
MEILLKILLLIIIYSMIKANIEIIKWNYNKIQEINKRRHNNEL